MAKNAIVGQSGGPTSVINASLAGVYESCKRRGAGKVYGMLHGVAGLLERRTCVLDEKLKTALEGNFSPLNYATRDMINAQLSALGSAE